MSSSPLFSPAEHGFSPVARKPPASVLRQLAGMAKLGEVVSASRLAVRPAPEMVPSGVRELDALTGGWPRGCLSEICGAVSSGRTSVLLAALAAATQRQEACALVDISDMFDPASAATAGVHFERLLWVRCDSYPKNPPRRYPSTALRAGSDTEKKRITDGSQMAPAVEQALRVTDLLLQSGGFGLVVVDLGGVPFRTARRIPLASWFRFQRAVEHTSTVLLAVTPTPCAQTCATVLLEVKAQSLVAGRWPVAKELSAFSSQLSPDVPAHAQLLEGLSVEGELLRSRLAKPVRSVPAAFETKAICAG